MAKGEPLKPVVQRLLRQARSVGVKPRLLLPDRGFDGVDVLRYLQAARYPFLVAEVIRSRKADDPRGPGGTRVSAVRKKSGRHEYTVTGGTRRTARVSICVSCRNDRGQRKRHGTIGETRTERQLCSELRN